MAIDRIGKGPPPAPPKPEKAGSAKQAGEVGKTFEVHPSAPPLTSAAPTNAPAAATAVGSTPLEKLRAGEIDLDRYLDLKVNDATAHLGGLPAAEMDALRSLLREQLSSDPGLVSLVQQATGQLPSPKG